LISLIIVSSSVSPSKTFTAHFVASRFVALGFGCTLFTVEVLELQLQMSWQGFPGSQLPCPGLSSYYYTWVMVSGATIDPSFD
jgi:hypothetical protein